LGEERETEAEQQSTKKKTMKTKQQNKQEKKNSSELQSRSEQLSGNNNSQTEKTLRTQNSELTTAPAPEPEKTINHQPIEQPSTINPAKRILPYVNFQQREENRSLSTDKVLDLLRRWMPQAYDLAEVVGKWVWITFPEQPAEQLRGQLSQFGFHWNNARKCWQHPCGQFTTEGSGADPRQKYGSHFAADLKAA